MARIRQEDTTAKLVATEVDGVAVHFSGDCLPRRTTRGWVASDTYLSAVDSEIISASCWPSTVAPMLSLVPRHAAATGRGSVASAWCRLARIVAVKKRMWFSWRARAMGRKSRSVGLRDVITNDEEESRWTGLNITQGLYGSVYSTAWQMATLAL